MKPNKKQIKLAQDVIREWDPEKLIEPGLNADEYDSYAEEWLWWAMPGNFEKPRELAAYIASRLNIAFYLAHDDNGGCYFINDRQPWTTRRCLKIAKKIIEITKS